MKSAILLGLASVSCAQFPGLPRTGGHVLGTSLGRTQMPLIGGGFGGLAPAVVQAMTWGGGQLHSGLQGVVDGLMQGGVQGVMQVMKEEGENPHGTGEVISFDFDGTLHTNPEPDFVGAPKWDMIEIMKNYARQGYTVVITTARKESENHLIWDFLRQNGVSDIVSEVYNAASKAFILREIGAFKHYDDRTDNLDQIAMWNPDIELALETGEKYEPPLIKQFIAMKVQEEMNAAAEPVEEENTDVAAVDTVVDPATVTKEQQQEKKEKGKVVEEVAKEESVISMRVADVPEEDSYSYDEEEDVASAGLFGFLTSGVSEEQGQEQQDGVVVPDGEEGGVFGFMTSGGADEQGVDGSLSSDLTSFLTGDAPAPQASNRVMSAGMSPVPAMPIVPVMPTSVSMLAHNPLMSPFPTLPAVQPQDNGMNDVIKMMLMMKMLKGRNDDDSYHYDDGYRYDDYGSSMATYHSNPTEYYPEIIDPRGAGMVVSFDFDGTLHSNPTPPGIGLPNYHNIDKIKQYGLYGYRVVITTARMEMDNPQIWHFLEMHGIDRYIIQIINADKKAFALKASGAFKHYDDSGANLKQINMWAPDMQLAWEDGSPYEPSLVEQLVTAKVQEAMQGSSSNPGIAASGMVGMNPLLQIQQQQNSLLHMAQNPLLALQQQAQQVQQEQAQSQALQQAMTLRSLATDDNLEGMTRAAVITAVVEEEQKKKKEQEQQEQINQLIQYKMMKKFLGRG